ncbi:CBM-cenC domain-containing protein [Fusarium sp. LHS14.1]|nr:CBM-cenC domain-containing protein [Fusarium sp. LHS14.1]
MRSTIPLLAFCHLSLASVCRPYSSSVTSILSATTDVPSDSESASSTTLSSTTLLEETESSTALSYSTTISSSSESSSTASEIEIVTSDSSTIPTTLATTLSVEPSTTTTSVSQGPTNIILNPGLEDSDTIAPWVRLGNFGSVSISTTEFHGGSQSGYFTGAPGGPANMGFRQNIDSSLLEADKTYRFSAYVKVTVASGCFVTFVGCGTGDAYFNPASFGGSGDWILATVTCSWTQARLDAGANVRVQGTCERLSFYMDDAVLEEVEAS